jgi:hypothetical protein
MNRDPPSGIDDFWTQKRGVLRAVECISLLMKKNPKKTTVRVQIMKLGGVKISRDLFCHHLEK